MQEIALSPSVASWVVGVLWAMAVLLGISVWILMQPVWMMLPKQVMHEKLDSRLIERLQTHVRVLSESLFPRSWDHPQILQQSASYIEQQLVQMGYSPQRQTYEVDGAVVYNIVLRLGPENSTEKILVIGAHYDSARISGNAQPASQLTHTPGADDNASGVAGLIELARLLRHQPPQHPVELVFYTLEEPPHFRTEFMGSYQHAQQLHTTQTPVRLMLSVEMIGFFSNEPYSQNYPVKALGWIYPQQGNFLALIGQLNHFEQMRRTKSLMQGAQLSGMPALEVYSLNAPAWIEGIDFSDHMNYWKWGFPAVMVTDTSFMRNPHYHQPTDTWQQLDYQRMAQVVYQLHAVALDAPALQ